MTLVWHSVEMQDRRETVLLLVDEQEEEEVAVAASEDTLENSTSFINREALCTPGME